MLYREEECNQLVRIKAKPGIVAKAMEVYKANHPFSKKVDFDELFEQLITLAAAKLGLVTNKDLGISEEHFKQLQQELDIQLTDEPNIENPYNTSKPEINDTLETESSALNLLN